MTARPPQIGWQQALIAGVAAGLIAVAVWMIAMQLTRKRLWEDVDHALGTRPGNEPQPFAGPGSVSDAERARKPGADEPQPFGGPGIDNPGAEPNSHPGADTEPDAAGA